MAFSGNKPEISLKVLKIKSINRIVFGQININSLWNKSEQLSEFCKDNLNILDSSFPNARFHIIPGYCSPSGFAVTLMEMVFCIREDIPSKRVVGRF